jgi:hypothetical protein
MIFLEGGEDIRLGDVILFPDLLSGAGECEGLFFAAAASAADGEAAQPAHRLRLLPSDVEAPVFPREMADLAAADGVTLRARYERVIERVLSLQGLSLSALLGGPTDEFWAAPDIQRDRPRRPGQEEPQTVVIPFAKSERIDRLDPA